MMAPMNLHALSHPSPVHAGKTRPSGQGFNGSMVSQAPVHPAPRFGQEADLFMATDVDDTLLPWKEGFYNQAIEEPYFDEVKHTLSGIAGRLNIAMVTGRGLSAIKELVGQFFKGFPKIRFLVVDNGKEIFVNHKNQPTQEWIASLHMSDQDAGWKRHMEKEAGWDQDLLVKTSHRFFNEAGFTEVHGREHRPSLAAESDQVFQARFDLPKGKVSGLFSKLWPAKRWNPMTRSNTVTILMSPDESSFYWFNSDTRVEKASRKKALAVVNNIMGAMREAGFPVHYRMSSHPGFDYFFFEPNKMTINKASAVDYILKTQLSKAEQERLKGILVCGDSENDVPMLARNVFTLAQGKPVRSYPILANDGLVNHPRLQGHPTIKLTPVHGNIAPALKHQIAQIDGQGTAELVAAAKTPGEA